MLFVFKKFELQWFIASITQSKNWIRYFKLCIKRWSLKFTIFSVKISLKWFFFQENLYMRLASRSVWRFWIHEKSMYGHKRCIFQIFWRLHCCAKFLSFELETSNFGYLIIFWFSLTMQSFRNIWQHLYQDILQWSPFDVFCFCDSPKIQRGDHCKMSNINVVQSFWNLA